MIYYYWNAELPKEECEKLIEEFDTSSLKEAVTGNYHEIESGSTGGDRDVHNLFEKFQPHISFTQDEEVKGRKILSKFGLPHGAKFVCLIVRDSAYLD